MGVGEARQQNLDELKRRREETMKAREETGAVTLRPGEVEGMRAEEDSVPGKSRAQEKRKREQEERRLLLQAKRQKKGIATKTGSVPAPLLDVKPAVPSTSADPFAALEAQAQAASSRSSTKQDSRTDADAFLAQLEQDVLSRRSG